MRGLVIGLLPVVLAGHAAADDSTLDAARIRAQLESKVAVDVAWGLHNAVEARLPDVDDLVRRALVGWTGDDWPARAVRTAAIDAVIELDVALPDDLLRATALDTGVPRQLLLASRRPAECREILRALLSPKVENHAWIAACNLLVPQRDTTLTSHLLSLLRLEANLTIRDPAQEERITGWGEEWGVSTACGQVSAPEAAGWPPRFGWELLSSPRPEARLVAKGRTSIYAVRHPMEAGDFVCSTKSASSRRYRSPEFLVDLLRWDVDELRSSLSAYKTIEFTDLPSWQRADAELRSELKRAWYGLLLRCNLAGVLTVGQALALPPRIVLRVDDQRSVKDPTLPIPPGTDHQVRSRRR